MKLTEKIFVLKMDVIIIQFINIIIEEIMSQMEIEVEEEEVVEEGEEEAEEEEVM